MWMKVGMVEDCILEGLVIRSILKNEGKEGDIEEVVIVEIMIEKKRIEDNVKEVEKELSEDGIEGGRKEV